MNRTHYDIYMSFLAMSEAHSIQQNSGNSYRKTSIPVSFARRQNSNTTLSEYEVYPTALAPRRSICKGISGTASLSAASLSHGSSRRKRIETSKVAPPQHSKEYALRRAMLVGSATFNISIVRSLVARRL
mmetsp:Transcript_29112/g.33818  ORF Transcript_29112/g.33818 Transcript_29112/m.33818 type:complete len:130 (-) Transcript_29112:212-601(-)